MRLLCVALIVGVATSKGAGSTAIGAAPTASSKSSSLLPLMPCAVGGQAGRHGLCAGATTNPVSLRGSNYVRLDSYHSNFEAATSWWLTVTT
eukprot:gene16943-5192_t